MAKENHGQFAFNAGEWSPHMLGRQDLNNYSTALFSCLNWLPLVQGGLTRRPGTIYLTSTKYGASKDSILIPFAYSTTQTYQLEFGDGYIRFFTSHSILTSGSKTITDITQATQGVVTIASHGYSDGDRLILTSIGGMTQLEGREVAVSDKTTNTFKMKDVHGDYVDTSGYDAFDTSGTAAMILEIATTYADTDLDELRWTQSADTLYLTHPDFPTSKLVREDATSWTLSVITFFDGPYDDINDGDTTLTPSATTGSGITITASAVTGINDDQGFLSTDVDRLVRIEHSSTWGFAQITAVTDTKHVTADVISDFGGTGAVKDWRLGLYSDTSGWPAVCGFHQDRFILAHTALYPNRIDLSRSSRYENFRPTDTDGTVADDHAIGEKLASGQVNSIRWVKSGDKGLVLGTSDKEWLVRPSLLSDALTPTDISAIATTNAGSAATESVSVDNHVLFLQGSQKKVEELSYQYTQDGFHVEDVTILADHISLPYITKMVFQRDPQPILWCVRSDGELLSFTYQRDHGVLAWGRHELGGASDAAGTFTLVKDVCVTKAPDGRRDELYLIAERYINGQTERYVELMSDIWQVYDDQTLAFHIDCGLTFADSGGFVVLTGLWHLEGETVTLCVDGAAHPDQVVTNGQVLVNGGTRDAYVVSVGKRLISDAELMPIEAGVQDGTAQGRLKKINTIGFWMVDTLGLKYGPSSTKLTEVLFSRWGDVYGDAVPLFTGISRNRFEGDHDRLGLIYMRADGPFPANIMSIQAYVDTEEES